MTNSKRSFGFAQIDWKVENFFGATSKEKWIISSPVFIIKGKISTSWRLFLKQNYVDGKHTVCVYLEKVNHSFREPIWVTWRLLYPSDTGETFVEHESDFENIPSLGIEISQNDELDTFLKCKDEDKLLFKSMIFVSAKDSEVQNRSSNPNLKALSHDMTTLYRVIKNRDIKLHIGGFPVKFHKGVLSSRCAELKAAIAEKEVVTFPELDTDEAKKVFGYLYTGNLDYILRKPSFAILQCIKRLGLTQLENYYEPDLIELLTKFKTKTCKIEFVLPIEKLRNQNEIICFPSAESGSSILERIFTLNVYPKCTNEEDDYISLSIKNMENNFSDISHCEVTITDTNGGFRNVQRERCYYFYEEINFEDILSKDYLNNSTYLTEGNLHLSCNLYISDTVIGFLKTKKSHVVYDDIVVNPETHYKMLSNHMALLFRSWAYSDFTLTCNEMQFHVHSYILGARSYIFRDLLTKQFLRNTKSMDLSSIRSDILKSVLMYMYCGVLVFYKDEDLLEIYEVAERFVILPLKYECSKQLQENLEYLDVKSVKCLAEEFKDYKLQTYIKNFMSGKKNGNENSLIPITE